jgi:hypothetical protein
MKIPSILILLTIVSSILTFKLKSLTPLLQQFTYEKGSDLRIEKCQANQPLKLIFPCNKADSVSWDFSNSDKFNAYTVKQYTVKPCSDYCEYIIPDLKSPATAEFTRKQAGKDTNLRLFFDCKQQ